MNLNDLLLKKKSAILKRWFDAILATYPSDTTNFLKKQTNRFANPVGYTILQGIEGLFEELVKGINSEKVSLFLDNIIRIRAIQDFTPSHAISFIFLLKKVIREELEGEIRENRISDEMVSFDSRIDDLALLAFDIYMKCREKLYEIKSNEVRNMTFRLLQKAKMVCGIQEEEVDPESETLLTQYKKG